MTAGLRQGWDPRQQSYRKLVETLFSVNERQGAVKLGLQNILRLDKALGSPSKQLKYVHVTGTNGKGSVCFKMAKSFEAMGFRTGLFTSPHISCYRERMSVDGDLLSEEEFLELMPWIMNVAQEKKIPATFFELTTALAFTYFAQKKCEMVLLEVGLGGRLDSTNIIEKPELAIITSVGLEHQRILGDTHEAIAREKAGIAKAGAPMLLGVGVPFEPVREVCAAVGVSRLEQMVAEVGDYDQLNTGLARMGLEILGYRTEGLESALASRPPCRFEKVQQGKATFVLDVAHNAPAFEQFWKRFLREGLVGYDSVSVILALSSDKDAHACIRSCYEHRQWFDRVIFTRAKTPRAQDPQLLAQIWRSLADDTHAVVTSESLTEAIKVAHSESSRSLNIVMGSVFMMAEARTALGLPFPVDDI